MPLHPPSLPLFLAHCNTALRLHHSSQRHLTVPELLTNSRGRFPSPVYVCRRGRNDAHGRPGWLAAIAQRVPRLTHEPRQRSCLAEYLPKQQATGQHKSIIETRGNRSFGQHFTQVCVTGVTQTYTQPLNEGTMTVAQIKKMSLAAAELC